jgi:hypothetical protein
MALYFSTFPFYISRFVISVFSSDYLLHSVNKNLNNRAPDINPQTPVDISPQTFTIFVNQQAD